jgi:hypothetical protein
VAFAFASISAGGLKADIDRRSPERILAEILRSSRYRDVAMGYRVLAKRCQNHEQIQRDCERLNLEAKSMEGALRARRRAEHFARLKEKYLRAATEPWKPVEPDPPVPE